MLDYANYGVTKTRNVNISLGGRRACFKTSACITKNAPNWILNASIAMPVPDPLDVHAEITHGTIGINPLKLKIITLSFSSRKSQRFFVKKKIWRNRISFLLEMISKEAQAPKKILILIHDTFNNHILF